MHRNIKHKDGVTCYMTMCACSGEPGRRKTSQPDKKLFPSTAVYKHVESLVSNVDVAEFV